MAKKRKTTRGNAPQPAARGKTSRPTPVAETPQWSGDDEDDDSDESSVEFVVGKNKYLQRVEKKRNAQPSSVAGSSVAGSSVAGPISTIAPVTREEAVSDLQDNSSVHDQHRQQIAAIQLQMTLMQEELKKNQNYGGASMVSGGSIVDDTTTKIIGIGLRNFVAEKIFPGWKFIFKKEKLGRVVLAAMKHGYVSKPGGVEDSYMEENFGQTVRNCLDRCRANAQSGARKRFLSKLERFRVKK